MENISNNVLELEQKQYALKIEDKEIPKAKGI